MHEFNQTISPGSTMQAMVLDGPHQALRQAQVPIPVPGDDQILIRVGACGVCRTDLHIIDGELAPHKAPLILGHEVVGMVVQTGRAAKRFGIGARVGIPWLGGTCHQCTYCRASRENLCDSAIFTGYDRDGGYAQYVVADARYCLAIPDRYDDAHAAPLLCAGLIGYRAYAMAGHARRIGLYGFGAAAHIIAQVARHQGNEIYAFTRPGDRHSQQFALSLGGVWAGDADAHPPELLDAAIIFAPVGALVPRALASTCKGATVVCAGIHMQDIPGFPYALLWGERVLRSVANLTRADGEAFFAIAQQAEIQTVPVIFRLDHANEAVAAVRGGRIDGAAVLVPERKVG